MSEERMVRVQAELADLLPDGQVISETSESLESVAAQATPALAAREPVDAAVKAALAERLARAEESWCSESVPVLGGRTPREAAEDPTQRDRVIRLIDSLPAGGGVTDEGTATMRPDRLQELLGIS